MKHYVNVNDIYKNNNCFKYLLYMQHSKKFKNFKFDLYSQGAHDHIWGRQNCFDVNETTKLQYEHVVAQLWVSKKKHS